MRVRDLSLLNALETENEAKVDKPLPRVVELGG